ncbi:MAG TPA: hypothetical protein VL307_04040 [Chitinophagaceae bacterium]|nr:hypothetical protein [Chitinophagaceae bacterium]
MKKVHIVFALSLLAGLGSLQTYAQQELPEVTVLAVRYKYLKAVDNAHAPEPVKLLERKAASFDVKKADFYEDDYDNYFVSFYIPEGEILATYDNNGKLLRTAEKYKDIALPQQVREAVIKRFPQWGITKDVYLVNFFQDQNAKKVYKLILQNGDKRLRIKVDDKGEFI